MKKQSEQVVQWVCEIALDDSQAAFRSLFLHYYQRIMRFILLYISSRQEAEEILSDIFLAIWQNRKTLPEVTNFDSYLYKIAYYKIVSQYRKRNSKMEDLDISHIDMFLRTETTPEQDLITKEYIDLLNTAINSLPEKCKLIFKFIREDKLKYKEVAEIMNISVKTVEAHLATAVRKLRETLNKQMEN